MAEGSIKVRELLRKADSLKSQRHNFETEWERVAEVFRPIRADIVTDRSKGDKSQIHRLYDSFPINAVSTLRSIVIGVFFNRSIKPISIKSTKEEVNKDSEVSAWLTDFADMMLKNMFDPKSNFERALSEAVEDDIVIGTPATFIQRGSKFVLNYTTLNIKNFLIAESQDNDVDYVIIKSKRTARQLVQQFEASNLHEKILEAAEKNPFEEFPIQLHIFPRSEGDKSKRGALDKPIAGIWIDEKHKTQIEEVGWDSMPVAVGRSEKATGEIYGTSKGMVALASGRQSNDMWRQLNEASELSLRPPLNINAEYDRVLNLSPAALNFPDQKLLSSGRPSVEPIVNVGNIPINERLIERVAGTINEIFFLDKLKIFDNPNATATQVLELRAESFRIMGDFMSGLIQYMDQLLSRTFDILFTEIYDRDVEGRFFLKEGNDLFDKPLPDLLAENPDLKINYINPITQSQRLNESAAIDKMLQDTGLIAEFRPEVLDLINADEVVRRKGEILNVDPDLINSRATVKKERDKREAQLQEQQEQLRVQEATETAAKAKTAGLI